MYITDNPTYGDPDSGCRYASEFLGVQSSCFECPFMPRCLYDMTNSERNRYLSHIKPDPREKVGRNLQIIKMDEDGVSQTDIGNCFVITSKRVHIIVKRHYERQKIALFS